MRLSLPRLGGLLSGCPRRKATKPEKRAILSTKSPLGRTKGVGLGLGSRGRLRGSAGLSIFGGGRGAGVAKRISQQVQAIRNATGYRGVAQSRKTGRYRGVLNFEGRKTRTSWFLTAIEAAKAYDRLAVAAYGDRAWLNFPVAGGRQALAIPAVEAATCRYGHPFPTYAQRRGKGTECLACKAHWLRGEDLIAHWRRRVEAIEGRISAATARAP
jgi:hypothetical protein